MTIYPTMVFIFNRREVKRMHLDFRFLPPTGPSKLPTLQPDSPLRIERHTLLPWIYKSHKMELKDLQYEPNGIFYNLGTKPEAGIKTMFGFRQKFHVDPRLLEENGHRMIWDLIKERTDPSVKGGMFRKWSKDLDRVKLPENQPRKWE